ncbi:Immunoglobulin V-set domain [Trinorchestia longiramus]|nr:Immunoglobulin V-set domain [Trinorchestia longiramus]
MFPSSLFLSDFISCLPAAPTSLIRLVIFFAVAIQGRPDQWKEDMNEEQMEIHRFALENGLWTPDPEVLVGTPESRIGNEGAEWERQEGGEAEFKTRNNSIVSVQAGSAATLPCSISKVHDTETVSWIRRHDSHLLSLNDRTYSSDGRISAVHDPDLQTWTLTIQPVRPADAGVYACQLSSHPPSAIQTKLVVLQSVSEISGTPDMYVESGSNVTLKCTLRHFTRPPAYVFWYHGKTMINYDTSRRVSVSIRGGESRLLLTRVSDRDSGNYTCQPANSQPSSVTLHIIPGEAPAAMQGAAAYPPTLTHTSLTLTLSLLSLILSPTLTRNSLTPTLSLIPLALTPSLPQSLFTLPLSLFLLTVSSGFK